jgi:hypothetical protein
MPTPESMADCRSVCPYKEIIGFEGLLQVCEGPRVRLDIESEILTDDDVPGGGELAHPACGSVKSIDKNIPSVSIVDYAETSLSLRELAELHRRGHFN